MRLILQEDHRKELYGLDLSEEMLSVAKAKIAGNRVKLLLGGQRITSFFG